MGRLLLHSRDHVRRALESAEDVQKSIVETKRAIERSQLLLVGRADPWPTSPANIRRKFWSHLDHPERPELAPTPSANRPAEA